MKIIYLIENSTQIMYKSMEKVENVFIVFQKTFGEEGKEMSVHKLVKKQKTKE